MPVESMVIILIVRRSRKGAWIEILPDKARVTFFVVAPVRERGLKLMFVLNLVMILGRSRKGAWIEIALFCLYMLYQTVAPVRERGLKLIFYLIVILLANRRSRKGAWIEIKGNIYQPIGHVSLP